MVLSKKNLIKIKGDASFRKFYRKKNKNKTSIVIYANKEKKNNLLIYDAVNKLLIKNKIFAPKLIKENYKENYIEIEDFGDENIYNLLINKKIKKLKLFKKIILLLIKIQKIKKNKIYDFKKKNYNIPKYSKSTLLKEAAIFSEWYVPKVVERKKISKLNRQLKKEIKFLLSKIKLPNNTFVHRDFHISNLMYYKKNFGVLDSQDALIGNMAYDLASLVDDVRYKTPKKIKNLIYKFYINSNKRKFNKNHFLNDFEILSVLRNLKIIGIFTRLAKRDKKKGYLKLIPYAWKLIEFRLEKNTIFKELKKILDFNFSNKIRIIK